MSTELNINILQPVSNSTQRTHEKNQAAYSGKQLPPTNENAPQAAENVVVKKEDLSQAVKNLNDYVQNIHRELQFSVDEDSGRTVIKVVDSDTQKVLRQIPPDEILKLARHLSDMENEKGALLKVRA